MAKTPGVTKQIGATVRRVRGSMGLTLGDVAKRADISAGMLSRLENGDVSPSLETLAALTAAGGQFTFVLRPDVDDRMATTVGSTIDTLIDEFGFPVPKPPIFEDRNAER